MLAHQPVLGGHRHHLMIERRVALARADIIEMQTDITYKNSPRAASPVEHLDGFGVEIAEMFFDNGLIEFRFAFKIVVKQSFVDWKKLAIPPGCKDVYLL